MACNNFATKRIKPVILVSLASITSYAFSLLEYWYISFFLVCLFMCLKCSKPLPLDADTTWSCLDWSQITLNVITANNQSIRNLSTTEPDPSSCPVKVKASTGLSFPCTVAEKDTLCMFASGIRECVCEVFKVHDSNE